MKKTSILFSTVCLISAILLSCSEDSPNSPNNGPAALDLTVVGKWDGVLGAIPLIHFNGETIFASFSGADSTFTLITRDPTRGTALPIKDTTLVLSGTWRLNAPKDSVLLFCDTSSVIDTAQNILRPQAVRGQIVPVSIKSIANSNGHIYWTIVMTDFLPLAPLLNINIPDVEKPLLQAVSLILEKISQ